MVTSSSYEKIEVSSLPNSSRWQGIPVVYELRDNLIATLTPTTADNKHYNMLSIFDKKDQK